MFWTRILFFRRQVYEVKCALDFNRYEEGKEFAARMRQRSKELKEAIFDKSEAAQFRQRKPLVAKARQCLEALKPPQPNDREVSAGRHCASELLSTTHPGQHACWLLLTACDLRLLHAIGPAGKKYLAKCRQTAQANRSDFSS